MMMMMTVTVIRTAILILPEGPYKPNPVILWIFIQKFHLSEELKCGHVWKYFWNCEYVLPCNSSALISTVLYSAFI
jgi:hypothetical protein